jgi:hypothetical protein
MTNALSEKRLRRKIWWYEEFGVRKESRLYQQLQRGLE